MPSYLFVFLLRCAFVVVWAFSLVLESEDYILAAEQGLLIAAASLVAELWIVVTHVLSCYMACGIFPDQGLNMCLLHWQVDSLPLSHQGSPEVQFLILFKNSLLYFFNSKTKPNQNQNKQQCFLGTISFS